MIFPRIWWRKPLSSLSLGLLSYGTVSIFQISDAGKKTSSRCDSFNSFNLSCIISIIYSGALKAYFRQPNILRVSQTAADDTLSSNGSLLIGA
jgi:hypothetical protein